MKEERQMTKEEAADFYKQHEGTVSTARWHSMCCSCAPTYCSLHSPKDHFETLIDFMSSGPCMTLVVSKKDVEKGVVEEIRNILGPKDVEKAKEEAPTR